MEIKVMGSGCSACKKLFTLTQEAVSELDAEGIDVIYVTDMAEIVNAGIMQTPALMIDGKVKVAGRVPKLKEIVRIVSDEI